MTKYIDINIIQAIPAANLNRDDNNQAKTETYGGTIRARVSSQSWKHAMRLDFEKDTNDASWLTGLRSTTTPQAILDEMLKLDPSFDEDEAKKLVIELYKVGGAGKVEEKDKTGKLETAMTFFISHAQIEGLAKYLITNKTVNKEDKAEIKKLFTSNNALDQALFGRMVANDASLNCDASCQVMHSFSVNELVPEDDYWTVVNDDAQPGSGFSNSDVASFNASTFYRYANVNYDLLKKNLGSEEAAKKGIEHFIKSFILSMPSGKQNSFANKTLPDYIMVTVRDDTPVNLASSFENAVQSKSGYTVPAIKRLEETYESTQKLVEKPVFTGVVTTKSTNLNEADNLYDLIESTIDALD